MENKKLNRIRDILKSKGISQTWLAGKTGISDNSLSAICRNANQPKLETLYKIAEALELDVRELLVFPAEDF